MNTQPRTLSTPAQRLAYASSAVASEINPSGTRQATDEVLPFQAIAERLATGARPDSAGSIVDRLARRFGYGTGRTRRVALYQRLQKIVDSHGERAELLIAEAASQATAARFQDRYFCKAVVAKMREAGLWVDLNSF